MFNYDYFANKSLDISTLKILVKANKEVKLYAIHSLGKNSYMNEFVTDKNVINQYKKSDIGEQFGYYDEKGNKGRYFVADLGMDKNQIHNKHLVFTTKELAEKYLEFSKTDSYMLNEYEKFVDSMNEWDTYVDGIYDYHVEEY